MQGASDLAARVASNPLQKTLAFTDPTAKAQPFFEFNNIGFTPLHQAAVGLIKDSFDRLSPKNQDRISSEWIRITHVRNKKGGGIKKRKQPSLKNLEKLALKAAEMDATQLRTAFGKTLRSIRKQRRAHFSHSSGGYTQKMVNKAGADATIQVGESIPRRGAPGREKGLAIRIAEATGRLNAGTVSPKYLKNLSRRVRLAVVPAAAGAVGPGADMLD